MFDDSTRFADFEADEERDKRSARRIHALERRVAQLEAQVESLLAAYQPQPSPWQLGLELEGNGSVPGHRRGARG